MRETQTEIIEAEFVNPNRKDQLDEADGLKDSLRRVGAANQKLSKFCGKFLFANEKGLSRAEAARRDVLMSNFQGTGETIGDCTIRMDYQRKLIIEYKGRPYDYIWQEGGQDIWVGGYPQGEAIHCYGAEAPYINGIGSSPFRLAAREDYKSHAIQRRNAEQIAGEQQRRRGGWQRIWDGITRKKFEPQYPALPEETPALYPAASRIADDATEALEAACAALKEMQSPQRNVSDRQADALADSL